MFHDFTPVSALIGGAMVGLSASLLMLSHGRIAGISDLFGRILKRRTDDRLLAMAFIAGLVIAGFGLRAVWPASLGASVVSLHATIAAGLLVGYGTRLGNGCTSGHGVCGLSRLSPRSLVATLTFILTGAATVFVIRHVIGGSP
jgi:uncharacterized membrane protein YedE/YeeE